MTLSRKNAASACPSSATRRGQPLPTRKSPPRAPTVEPSVVGRGGRAGIQLSAPSPRIPLADRTPLDPFPLREYGHADAAAGVNLRGAGAVAIFLLMLIHGVARADDLTFPIQVPAVAADWGNGGIPPDTSFTKAQGSGQDTDKILFHVENDNANHLQVTLGMNAASATYDGLQPIHGHGDIPVWHVEITASKAQDNGTVACRLVLWQGSNVGYSPITNVPFGNPQQITLVPSQGDISEMDWNQPLDGWYVWVGAGSGLENPDPGVGQYVEVYNIKIHSFVITGTNEEGSTTGGTTTGESTTGGTTTGTGTGGDYGTPEDFTDSPTTPTLGTSCMEELQQTLSDKFALPELAAGNGLSGQFTFKMWESQPYILQWNTDPAHWPTFGGVINWATLASSLKGLTTFLFTWRFLVHLARVINEATQ